MLPSGNDAAQAICENLGRLLQIPRLVKAESGFNQGKDSVPELEPSQPLGSSSANVLGVSVPDQNPPNTKRDKPEDKGQSKKKKEPPTRPFLQRMNKLAETLGMTNTVYCNPHGLMNKFNYSSCLDVAKLLAAASMNSSFVQVISAAAYSTVIIRNGESTTIEWENTHKCFDDNRFLGGKTGTTVAAGPCLSSLMKLGNDQKIGVVILNSRHYLLGSSVTSRTSETKKVTDWIEKHYDSLVQLDLTYP